MKVKTTKKMKKIYVSLLKYIKTFTFLALAQYPIYSNIGVSSLENVICVYKSFL